jgi:Holliday junction DNA helicase RuvA
MIKSLNGILARKSPTSVVIDVNGVGYGLAISLFAYDQLPEEGEQTQILTYLYVREDRLELFGFADEREREMFEHLISISGIGPNSAQIILSGMSMDDLRSAIANERSGELTSIKGIGRKTAERMVVELKDKIRIAPNVPSQSKEGVGSRESEMAEEAVLALTALGINAASSRSAVRAAIKKNGDAQNVQTLIKRALQER